MAVAAAAAAAAAAANCCCRVLTHFLRGRGSRERRTHFASSCLACVRACVRERATVILATGVSAAKARWKNKSSPGQIETVKTGG